MSYSSRATLIELIALATLCVAFSMPLLARAQTQPNNLRSTIRAEILSDPRSAGLSETQIDTMVNILAQQAQEQGVTANDITWRPQQLSSPDAAPVSAPDYCGTTPGFLCAFDLAFGFAGNDPTIPFFLGMASMGLIWIVAEKLHAYRMHAPPTQASAGPV